MSPFFARPASAFCLASIAILASPAFAQSDDAEQTEEPQAPSATVYNLGFEFHDHDGSTSELAAIAVMRTGTFVGSFTATSDDGAQVTEPLCYAWAWYHDGYIVNQPQNNDFLWLHGPGAGMAPKLETSDDGAYNVSIPMGTRDYPDLPATDLTLRIWLGTSGSFQFNGTQVPTGVLGTLDIPVNIVETPFAIWVESPRNNETGSLLGGTVVTSQPVEDDTYFELSGGGTASPNIEMVMIPAGSTCSEPFGIQMSEFRGAGRVTATRVGDSVAVNSSEIECGSLGFDHSCPECSGTGEHPEIHITYILFELCVKQGSPGGFGAGNKEECGDCAATPTAPSLCNHGPNDDVYPDQNQPDCQGITLWWDCELYKHWVPAAKYHVTNQITTGRGCAQGSTNGGTSTSSGGSIGLDGTVTTPGNGSVGANGSYQWSNAATTATNMNTANQRICCTLVYAGQGATYIIDCRDID